MMRKMGFGGAPAKAHGKPSAASATTRTEVPAPPPYMRHPPKDTMSSSTHAAPPFISRQQLSPQTERELRAACALILKNFKPSDHGLPDTDPKLDFQGYSRPRDHRAAGDHNAKDRRPTAAPPDALAHGHGPGQTRHQEGSDRHAEASRRGTASRRRADAEHDPPRQLKPSSTEHAHPPAARSDLGSDIGTPHTGSTRLNNGSTAPTSATVTTGNNSNRGSRQSDSHATAPTGHAAEWARHGMERKAQHMVSQPPPPTAGYEARPPSRARSIKEYIFPSSATLSRKHSQDSLRSTQTRSTTHKDVSRSNSSHGWRSWGLHRMSSSRSASRPGTSGGPTSDGEPEKRTEINLNRDLPPLPSLDSWDKQELARKSTVPGAHIATVMRSDDHAASARVRHHHRRSGSDTLALRFSSSVHREASSPAYRTTSVGKDRKTAAPQLETSTASADAPHAGDNGGGSTKVSCDWQRAEYPPNFSRKISTDIMSPRSLDGRDPKGFQNEVHLASTDRPISEKQTKSGLRKVLSGWLLRKEKKENWMDQFEKNGIRGGVMIQDEAALPPVVRY